MGSLQSWRRSTALKQSLSRQYVLRQALSRTIQYPSVNDLPLICVIKQDAGVAQDCVRLVQSTIEKLNGLDIIISNAVSSFDRNFRLDLTVKGLDKVYQVQ